MIASRIRNAPIQRKLTLLVVAAVALALVLTCAAFAANHFFFARAAMAQQLGALAEVLGSNTTAALLFDDSEAAVQVLESLRQQPDVEHAWLFGESGEPFAHYTSETADTIEAPEAPQGSGSRFWGENLRVWEQVNSDGEHVGTIIIQANLAAVRKQLASYAGIIAVVMLVAFAAAQLLALPLQRAISRPILALAKTAERVSSEHDYTIRVEKQGNDEIGGLYDQFNRMLAQVEAGEKALQQAHDDLERRVVQRTRELSETNSELKSEVVERLKAEQELERAHRELLEAARHAGMAEIASGVLHNVGNVLNSVNVSSTTIAERLRSPKRRQLDRVVSLLEENRDTLGDFLTNDDRGKQVPVFLSKLAESMRGEDDQLSEEAVSLSTNIDHIKAIIATQQSYAGTSGIVEPLDLQEVLEDALKLNSASFNRHAVRVVREFADLPRVVLDKQRLLQIVINLVKNAKEALLDQDQNDRVLTLRTWAEGEKVFIEIADTGVGIAPECLSKVFAHGYTTKNNGHGFGLHSCANAATEMNGELRASSDGPMTGARFTLCLPYRSAEALVGV